MRGLLVAMMCLAALPVRAEERPSYDQIVRQFEAIAFTDEEGPPRGWFTRWERVPVRILSAGVPASDIERVAAEIRTLTGLTVILVGRGESHNVAVSFASACYMDGRGAPVKVTIQPNHLHRCLYAELFQAVGPANDACHYRPSLFCDGEKNETPTWADRIIMRATFDKRLRVGMKPAEAMPIARQIIRELYDAGW